MIIYCDGIFDLFHIGHLNHFKKIHSYFEKNYSNDPVYLLVGVISDNIATEYKRKPIMNELQRLKMVLSILYVNNALITDMLTIDEEFIKKNKIDYVVHSYFNENDKKKQDEFFDLPIKLNKFIEIPYNYGVSTTDIINKYYNEKPENIKDEVFNWNQIWENKGNENTSDLYLLNGWEETKFDPNSLISHIVSLLNIQKQNTIMEYGCGSGLLSTYLKDYEYYGLDYSLSLVSKNIKLLNNIVFNFNCSETIFKNKYFDYVIINSMLEYLTSTDVLKKTISEVERISKKGIYIANIRQNTHNEKKNKHKYNGIYTHLIIDKEYFINLNYTIIDSLYDPNRYDAYKIYN